MDDLGVGHFQLARDGFSTVSRVVAHLVGDLGPLSFCADLECVKHGMVSHRFRSAERKGGQTTRDAMLGETTSAAAAPGWLFRPTHRLVASGDIDLFTQAPEVDWL